MAPKVKVEGRAKRVGQAKTFEAPESQLTFPVGVLIRDNDNHVFFLSALQLEQFRRTDLETSAFRTQLNQGNAILGLKNAWRIDGFGIASGD